MTRRAERALLVSALGIGLVGAVLVAVARGATRGDPLETAPATIGRVAWVWAQAALATFAIHFALVFRRSRADQLLLPVSLALTGLGLAVIFSLQPAQAQRQMNWLWLALGLLLLTVTVLPDLRGLRRYRYTFGLATALLLVLPMLAGPLAVEVNGAKLWLQFGSFRLQPGELAKITLVLFLAGYLEENAELMVGGARRLAGMELPSLRYLGPVLAMWLLGMVLLVGLRDLGTALLFFGTLIAMLYAATAQAGYLLGGGASFLAAAYLCMLRFGHVRVRLAVWLDPWSQIDGKGYQIAQGLFAIAAGGLTGVGLGLGEANRIPAAITDFPFAGLCEELGFWGAALTLALFLVWVYRAFRVALAQTDRFRGYLALGLGCLMATQTVVILAGVTKLIPLTGITVPFISYGGSSLLTNYLMLGLLLRCSEEVA